LIPAKADRHWLRHIVQALAFVLSIYAQTSEAQSVEVSIGARDSVVVLSERFILRSSLKLLVDSSVALRESIDYVFDQEHSTIQLTDDSRRLLFGGLDTATRHWLSISYSALPLDLKQSYSLYETASAESSDSGKRIIAPTPQRDQPKDLVSNFQRSGAITRGFQLGSGRDLALTSGFNLQFTGELAEDVTVTGALTEETIPIQPEGNTQTLRELDRIYINLKASKFFEATFGDFYLDLNSGRGIARLFEQASVPSPMSLTREWQTLTKTSFTSLSRKVLGVEAIASLPFGAFTAGAASNKGRFTSNTIQGQEFFQGPYRLIGINGERAAPVLAGTERVYVDGILQTRGERNDYVIDYATGELTFQPRRLITSASRITIDFEYAEQAYSRTLVIGQAQSMIVPGAVYLGATLLREGDNPDATLTLSLSDEDREILKRAGNDPSKAFRSGVRFEGRTDAGRAKGSYVKADTLINAQPVTFYRYDPQDSINALYSVAFGAVGTNGGSYTRRAISEFVFVGPGRGEYDTLVPLPLPQLTEVLGFNTVIRPFTGLTLSGEVAGSRNTANRFAPLPEDGVAYRYSLGAADSVPLFGSLHSVQASFRSESVRPTFQTLDRINSVEFDRSYGFDLNRSRVKSTDYRLDEGRISLAPFSRVILDGSISRYRTDSSSFVSDRLATNLRVLEDSTFFPEIIANFETLDLSNQHASEQTSWQRLSGRLTKNFSLNEYGIAPYFAIASEDRKSSGLTTRLDSLTSNSFRFTELNPGVRLQLGQKVSLSSDIRLRNDDSVLSGVLRKVSNSQTLRFGASLNNLSGFSTLLSVTLRDKEYADSVSRIRNGGDQSGILLRFEPRYSSLQGFINVDGLYEISNQRTARIERLFFPVQRGYGNYKYQGDLNGNGRADVEEFVLARYSDEGEYVLITLPSEQLYPTTDLRTSLRLRLTPAGLFPSEDLSSSAELLRGISTETIVRLEERSTLEDEASIFLLDLSKFRNDSTTLAGLYELDQSLNLFENNAAHSYRLRFYERTMAQQYTTGLERTYRAERSLRGRFRILSDLTNETMMRSITDLALTRSQSFTQPSRVGGYGLESEWSYHPTETRLDYGLRGELLSTKESISGVSALANSVTLKSSYSLESRTRLRGEFERDELTLRDQTSSATLPYALTNGRTDGITWLWRLALDYNFGAGVIATLAYDGRNARTGFLTNERETIHNARAEVRAAF
jgi:hypothetical protein